MRHERNNSSLSSLAKQSRRAAHIQRHLTAAAMIMNELRGSLHLCTQHLPKQKQHRLRFCIGDFGWRFMANSILSGAAPIPRRGPACFISPFPFLSERINAQKRTARRPTPTSSLFSISRTASSRGPGKASLSQVSCSISLKW